MPYGPTAAPLLVRVKVALRDPCLLLLLKRFGKALRALSECASTQRLGIGHLAIQGLQKGCFGYGKRQLFGPGVQEYLPAHFFFCQQMASVFFKSVGAASILLSIRLQLLVRCDGLVLQGERVFHDRSEIKAKKETVHVIPELRP
jgi:hypothetical protein